MERRPNILFLMSDEHRADVTGYEGNKVIRTPNLDRLAKDAIVFRNAYTPAPICIPARQAMMAGQLPHRCACERFGDDLAPGYMTFARRFSEYAYVTVCCGKLHHMGQDQMQGWTRRVGADEMISPENIANRQIDEFASCIKPQEFNWGNDVKVVQRAGVGKGPYYSKDVYTVQGALHFIEEYFISPVFDRAQNHRPVLLKVSLVEPHYPYNTDEEKFNYYINRVKAYVDQPVSDHPMLSRRQVRPGIDVSMRELAKATSCYYGMVESMDHHMGVVLQALEQAGQNLNDWIIVYTSDHGEMLGEHGVWEKKSFYEGSVRVPLFIRWPKRFPQFRLVQENVNLCDLFATLCELADIPAPSNLDSRSLVSLMHGEAKDWVNETVSQYNGKELMIKFEHLKYLYYGEDHSEVLFDLQTDPGETKNAVEDPAYKSSLELFRAKRTHYAF